MSYDLFFRSRSSRLRFSRKSFVSYFKSRRWYKIEGSQALYSNEDSGVYFIFDYGEQDADSDDDADPSLIPVAFNLNFFRPHAFGLEAELEVAAFVREFDLTVSDPQMSGMGDGKYSAEGFLCGWNAGNEFAYSAFLAQDPKHRPLTLPSARIESSWRWNFERERRQNEMEEDVFVPAIFFFDLGGEVATGVIWGDGIPILLPVVDLVIAPREQLSPRRRARSENDMVVFEWSELEPVVRRFGKASKKPETYKLFYETVPAELARLIRDKALPKKLPQGTAFDQILNQELVEKAKSK